MKKYVIEKVELTELSQHITLRGIEPDAGVVVRTSVPRWRPTLKQGTEFIVYDYRVDPGTMVAQEYAVNGKIYFDVPMGWSKQDQKNMYDMMGMIDAAVFRTRVASALRARNIAVSANVFENLQKLMDAQKAEHVAWPHGK